MPFSSGVYTGTSNSFNNAAAGTIIEPGDWNDLFTDIELGLNDLSAGRVYAATDVASAATCDIGATSTSRVRITGSTGPITSLGTGANRLRFVHFTGTPTLTHNATSLILPGAANITVVANDCAIFSSDASGNWRCLLYSRLTLDMVPANFITYAKLQQGTALSLLGVAGGSGANLADIAAASDHQVMRRSGSSVGFGAVNLAQSDAVTGDLPFANIAQLDGLSVAGVGGSSTGDIAAITAGSDHQVMRRSGTAVAFGAVNLGQAAAITGALPIGNGGTNATDAATAFGNLKQGATSSATGVVEIAVDSEVRSAATGDKALVSALLESSAALVSLTETGGAVAVDWDTFINGTVTVDENTTISNPTNGQPGTWRTILVQGNNTTDRTISFGNQFLGELPTIADCDSGRWYLLIIYCVTSTHFTVSSKKANGT